MSSYSIDKKITFSEEIQKLLSKLTLEEKLGQLLQLDATKDLDYAIREKKIGSMLNLTVDEIEKVESLTKLYNSLPVLHAVDATHGHCFVDGATVFPTPLAMSCSWDPELLNKVGAITAKEMRATGYHWTYSPNLDLARDPRWGRVNETFGEDPHLVGVLGRALIEGLQNSKEKVAACVKHFAAYGESMGGRDSAESEVSERKLRSLFLPPYKQSIDAGVKSVMTAYQAIDGIPCTINNLLLKKILSNEWGFEGVVITDYDNVGRLQREQYVMEDEYEASIAAINAGNHVAMVTPGYIDHILKAVSENRVSIETIDQHVSRVLRMKFELGLFDTNIQNDSNIAQIGNETHMAFARHVCEESIVLLKNNGVLPISNLSSKLSVIGPNSKNRISQLGDWGIRDNFGKHDSEMGNDHEDTYISILDGLRSVYQYVNHHQGCTIDTDEENIEEAVEIAINAEYIIAVVGDNLGMNGEIKDRATLDLPGRQLELLKALKQTQKPLIAILINGKPLILNWLDEHADAIIETFNPGIQGGSAVANVLSGKVNPSGKITVSFPRHIGQLPVYYNQIPGWHGNSNGTGSYIDYTEKPLYPFGFGLSYSNFVLRDLEITPTEQKIGGIIQIKVTVKNTSDIEGREVVQVYFNDVYSSVTVSSKRLIGFQKVLIKAREVKQVTFEFETDVFSLINGSCESVVEPGEFVIMVGNSSKDEDLQTGKMFLVKP